MTHDAGILFLPHRRPRRTIHMAPYAITRDLEPLTGTQSHHKTAGVSRSGSGSLEMLDGIDSERRKNVRLSVQPGRRVTCTTKKRGKTLAQFYLSLVLPPIPALLEEKPELNQTLCHLHPTTIPHRLEPFGGHTTSLLHAYKHAYIPSAVCLGPSRGPMATPVPLRPLSLAGMGPSLVQKRHPRTNRYREKL
ncbi:hypothetical protein BC826DRAFT_738420 [Russula brevipes]|nr:hypothetical protein BC826DRAFT_738420 [Russula brevipes]